MTSSQIAAATAKTLAVAGQRGAGRWKRGTVGNPEFGNTSKTARNSISQAGTVLDHAPDLLDAVISGASSLDAALDPFRGPASYERAVSVLRSLDRPLTVDEQAWLDQCTHDLDLISVGVNRHDRHRD